MIFNNNTPIVFIKNKEPPAVVPCGETLGDLIGQPQGFRPCMEAETF